MEVDYLIIIFLIHAFCFILLITAATYSCLESGLRKNTNGNLVIKI